MPYTTSSIDGARLFYRDYRPASCPVPFQPQFEGGLELSLVFIHGWPMSSAMWEHLMLPLCESHRLRCVAVDRRGFGKSEWSGTPRSSIAEVDYNTFSQDTVDLLEELDLKKIVFVAASMGCGETLLAYLGNKWLREKCKVRTARAEWQHHRRECDC
jgi:non-heme chloroperoxidase